MEGWAGGVGREGKGEGKKLRVVGVLFLERRGDHVFDCFVGFCH